MKTMKDEMLTIINEKKDVTFAYLSRKVEGFDGDQGIRVKGTEGIIWPGMSKEATQAISDLLEEKAIILKVDSFITYLNEGLVVPCMKNWVPYIIHSTNGDEDGR